MNPRAAPGNSPAAIWHAARQKRPRRDHLLALSEY
jgi:hypothetical protein